MRDNEFYMVTISTRGMHKGLGLRREKFTIRVAVARDQAGFRALMRALGYTNGFGLFHGKTRGCTVTTRERGTGLIKDMRIAVIATGRGREILEVAPHEAHHAAVRLARHFRGARRTSPRVREEAVAYLSGMISKALLDCVRRTMGKRGCIR